MPIRSIEDLRRQAGAQWQDKTDEDLISAYADFVQADPVSIANTLGYKPSESGVTGQRFGAAFDRYQAGLYGLGEAVTGGLGFTGAQESLAERRRANEFEAAVASRAARAMGGIESFEDVQGIGDLPSYIGGLAIQSSPYIAEAAVGGLAARGLMGGTRAALGTAAQTGDVAAAQAARRTLNRGMLAGGAVASYPSSVGEILQAQREQTGTADLGTAAALGVPFAALNVVGVEGAAARLGAFRSMGEGLDALKGFRGGLTRAGVTGLRVGATEAASETGQEGISQLGRMAVDPNEQFLSPEAQERFKEAAIGGFALGKTFGTLGGGWRRSVEPVDLTRDTQGDLNRGLDTSNIRVSEGAGLSTQDLINQITGVTRPEGERPTRQSMEAALNEPTGRMVAGPGGIERPQTAGETFGIPPAPPSPAQPAPQQAQGAQPPQAQTPQIDPAVIQQTAQAYGVSQVPQAPGVPTQAFTIAGKTVFGVGNANNVVSQIAQTNQTKDPDRVRLESAVVASGIPIGGQPTAKGILGGIDSIIKKYQLDGAATLNDAANILEFQIGQAKSAKSAEPMARIYEALTGQMSPAFQRLSEGPTPAAGTAPLTPPESLGLMQQTGAPSGQPTPRATAPTPAATAAPAPTAAPVQAQPVPTAQRVSPTPSAGPEAAVTAGAQAWEDMNVSTVQYSDLSEQDRAAWDQAVAEGRATGEAQEQLAREYELIQEQGFMQQVLDRIIGRVIKSANKARYFSTFLVAGARQQDILATAEANAEKDADGNLTDAAKKQINNLRQGLSALRGAPNQELADEYGVKLDTLKEWNAELRTFLTDKAAKIQEAATAIAVELRLEGGDLRNILTEMAARNQQAQSELETATQPDQVVFDERDLAVEDAGVTAQDRTAASVQEVYNASETINARYLRLQQQLVDAENDGNQELADEITAQLDALTEEAAKQAAGQTGKRAPAAKKEKPSAVQKRETKKVSIQPRARGGEKVGQEVRSAQKPAAEGETQTQEKVLTEAEKATKKEVRESPAPINQKVAPLVSALNKQNISTALSGDLYGLDLVYVDIVAPWNIKIPNLPKGWFAGPNSALHTQAVTGDQTVGEVWKDPETAVEELQLQNLPVRLRLARPGGAVSESEARQVTSAVQDALKTVTQTTKAPSTQTTQAAVVLTKQEAAEAKYNELRQLVGDALPTWDKLTDAQRAQLVDIDPAQMNMRDLERIADDSRTIDVEAREVSGTERQLLLEQTNKLNDSQVKLLEQEYGAKVGTDSFVTQLSTDVSNYVNKGAEFVSAKIRAIIKAIASGVLAIGVIFNPNVQLNNFSFDLPSTYASTKATIIEVPADAAPKMSALAKSVYTQMAAAAQSSGKGFIIADKPNGMIHVFNADGSLLAQDQALYGKDIGDSIAGKKAALEGGPKITPAGQFQLSITPTNDYVGGFGLTLEGTNQPLTSPENIAQKKFTSTVAIHAAYLGNVNEKRLERIATPTAKDNRISYGCINTSHDLFLNKLKPNAKSFDGGMIFVLPDNPQFLAEEGKLPTPPAPKTPKQNAMRRRAEKKVQELTETDQNLMLEDASLDEMSDAYVGVASLRSHYESQNLGNVFNAVGQFFVSYNRNVDWDGIITNIDNQVSVVLRQDIATQKGASLWTMAHELGHAVDQTVQGLNTYSSDPRLNLRKTKDRVIPMGEVAVEMANLRKKNEAINTVLGYPYDFNEVSDLSTEKVRQELFAQLWALYTSNNTTRDLIDQQAPKTAAFMKEVIANVQTTENFNATNVQGPSFDSGKTGFVERRDSLDGTIGTAAKVALAQQNIPIARSRNARAAVNAIEGIPPTVKSASNSIYQTLQNWTRKGVDRVVFTEALINRAVESGITAANTFKRYIQERGVMARKLEQEVERIADMYAVIPDKDRGTGPESVNAFLYDSTRTRKWGFQPKWRATGVAVDAALRARFDAMSPEAKSFIRAVFQHGDKMLAMKKKVLMDFTNSEYDTQIKEAKADGNDALVAELQKEKIADLKKFDTLFKLREGIPYAPLKRIGKYAVVAKSPEYRQAEQRKDNKRLRELEQDPNHYHVSFADSDIQARNLRDQLAEQGFYGRDDESVYYFEREQFQDELYGGDSMLRALSKLRATVEKGGQDQQTTNRLRRIITDMYLHALADTSARKSELRRRAVPGEIDMLQSFALQGRSDANFLASVQYNDRTQEALQKMREQARTGGNRTRKSELLNELNGRYVSSLDYEPMPLVQKLNRITSVYFLASSPGYYLQNLTQPWMMSLPVMAGRHDYTKSANALYNAYFDLKGVMKSAKLFDQQFDFSKVPDDIKDVIETLVNRSQIDIGISTEMGEFQIEGQGPVTDTWNKVDKGLRLAVQKVEAINRLSTAIAAYRLELAKTGKKDVAIDYASSIINDTHGDYSGFNAPRMFNTNIGRVALQFRKFQLIQLGLLAKLIKNSFGDAKTDKQKEEQLVARAALKYILAQTAVITGVMGMPGAAAIAWALEGLFGDEDEPLDIKGQIRDAIGNEDIANIVLYGAPIVSGANISGKIGMGNALSVMPFTEIKNLNGEKTYEIVGTLLGGPAGGMAARMADGISYIAAGDEYKGLELMLPKGVGDAMKAVRIYSEGFTNRKGDVLLTPDQVSEVGAFWQALGLSPTQTSVRGEKQGRKIDLEQKFSERSSSLKRQYTEADRDRDTAKKNDLRRQWRELQNARVRNGYPRKPITELLDAPKEKRERERQTAGGIQFTPQSRQFVERITA